MYLKTEKPIEYIKAKKAPKRGTKNLKRKIGEMLAYLKSVSEYEVAKLRKSLDKKEVFKKDKY